MYFKHSLFKKSVHIRLWKATPRQVINPYVFYFCFFVWVTPAQMQQRIHCLHECRSSRAQPEELKTLTRTTVWKRRRNRNTGNNGSNTTDWKNNVSSSVIAAESEVWPRPSLVALPYGEGLGRHTSDRRCPRPLSSLPSVFFFFLFSPVWNTSRLESSSFPALDGDSAETGQQIQKCAFVKIVCYYCKRNWGEITTVPNQDTQKNTMTGTISVHSLNVCHII